MGFATRLDLLKRTNARLLSQVCVPADMERVPEDALRVAVTGGDLSAYPQAEHDSLAAALVTIDDALKDADELICGYGIPADSSSPLLARLASTIAVYFVIGVGNEDESVEKAYKAAVDTLKSHARGDINLLPLSLDASTQTDDVVVITSAPSRYGCRRYQSVFDGDCE